MNNDALYQRLAALVAKFSSFSIAIPINPTVDTVSAAIGLYIALTKSNKNVTIASASDIPATLGVTGSDKIQKNLATGGDNLIVSFPYTDGSIDKVTYNIEGTHFNLVIQPREGYDKLDPNQVKYTYSGGKVDVIIVIDAPTLNSLGELYTANQDQFKGKDIVNIDRHLTNGNFGTVNLLEKKMSSTSEIIMRMLPYLNVAMDKDVATTLYNGIVSATNNFSSYSVNPDTFEASAYLLKSGAVKKPAMRPSPVGVPLRQPADRQPYPPASQPYTQPTQPYNSYAQPLRQPVDRQPMAPMQPPMTPQPPAFDNSDGFDDEDDDMMFDPVVPQPPMARPQQPNVPQQPMRQPMNQQPQGLRQPAEQQNQQQVRQPMNQPISAGPSIESIRQEIKQVENKEVKADKTDTDEMDNDNKPAPQEWLKPKIFKGSNLV